MKILLATLALMFCLTLCSAADTLRLIRTEFTGPFKIAYVQVENNFAWDVVASTAGWGEVDLGYIGQARSWSVEPFIGVSFFRHQNKVIYDRAWVQFYTRHFGQTHSETWLMAGVPLESVPTQASLRHLTTRQLGNSAWSLGLQYDLMAEDGISPVHRIGPLVENKIGPVRLGFTHQCGQDGSRFFITAVGVF